MNPIRTTGRRGSAIILVLWCLLIIGMAVFGVVELVTLSVEQTSDVSLQFEAHELALSGLALGINPQIQKDDPLLSQKTDSLDGFDVAIQSEGARLNLNYVLLSGHREILVNLFAQWGLPVNEANHLADCLYDWITPGDLKSLNGAKANEYALAGLSQAPTHQPFVSFDEVDEVMDMDLLDKARSNWKDSFTLWSAGPLNVNEAPPALIAAVFGLDPLNVGNFTDSRNGRDGVAGTSDDVPVTDLRVFQGELGISDLAMKALNSEIELSDPMRRVTATGYSRDVKSTVAVVTQLNSNPIQYLLWSNH